MAGKKRTRCMKFASLFLLMLALVAADKARPDPKCPAGQVFDSGSEQCRHCGLCCLEHQQQMGCLEQGIDSAHSCFYDASCQDERDLYPADMVKTWGWQKILLIVVVAVIGLAVVTMVIATLVKFVKKQVAKWRSVADPADKLLVEDADSQSVKAHEDGNKEDEGPKEASSPGSLQGPSIATPGPQYGISPSVAGSDEDEQLPTLYTDSTSSAPEVNLTINA